MRHSSLADLHDPDAVSLAVDQHDGAHELHLRQRARQCEGPRLDHVDRSEFFERGDPSCKQGLLRREHEVIVAAHCGHDLLGTHGEESLGLEPQDIALLRLTEGRKLEPLYEEEGNVEGYGDSACGTEMLPKRLDRLCRVRRVVLDLHHAGSGSEPALESHTAQGAGPELDAEAGHHNRA